ncbi:MAG: lipoyl(octanoyl) transferase LipB [Dehalococcoidia bacterium]|nr:lipoyl(octanoyl) transferase LipB [Dehalococcoidia bacterium]
MTANRRLVSVYNLGLTGYDEVHRLQRRLQAQRRDGGGADSLLLTEHRPVLTLGRSHPEPSLRVPPATIAAHGIEIVATERGGDITYHGPGQLVAYGIIDLRRWECAILDYVSGLEDACIGMLADWGIRGQRSDRGRGVWVGEKKIAFVGLNVRRWITMHGIAINIDPQMSHFELINPCGMGDIAITSLAAEAGKPITFEEAVEPFTFHFARVFGCVAEAAEPGARASSRPRSAL